MHSMEWVTITLNLTRNSHQSCCSSLNIRKHVQNVHRANSRTFSYLREDRNKKHRTDREETDIRLRKEVTRGGIRKQ